MIMKTLVVHLDSNTTGSYSNNEPLQGTFGYYKSASIGITNPVNREWGCFLVRISSGSCILSLGGTAFKYGSTLQGAKDSGSFTYDLTMYSSQDYYIYIPSFLNTKLEFSDITKVDTFDASIDVGSSVATYEGIDIDAKDLMKFSLVRNLGLRYSVKNLDDFKPECFMYFTNLERLYIGAPNDENVFEEILLPDGVMRSLKDINWGIQKLPANFNELVNCEYFYLMTAPSWQALSSATFTSLAQCKVICTDPYNNDDVLIINRFRQAYNIPGYTTLIPSEVVVHNNNV
jgi:hypothetical protein